MPPDLTFTPREKLFSAEAEQAILGAAMFAAWECDDAFDRLRPDHFADPVHRRIWEKMSHLHRSQQATSPAFLRDRLGLDEGFAEWGGYDLLVVLEQSAHVHALAQNVATVVDFAMRRELQRLALSIEAKAADPACSTAEALLSDLERGACDIADGSATAEAFVSAADVIRTALDNAERRNGRIDFTTGIASLDDLTNGLHGGENTVIAGWTGMGKTLAGLHLAVENARRGVGTCYFSLEMAGDPMGVRLACNLAYSDRFDHDPGPTVDSVVKNLLSGFGHRERLRTSARLMDTLPLLLDVRHGLTMAQIEAAARRQHRRWRQAGIVPGPVIIDHIGKVKPSDRYRGDRTGEITEASNDCMGMAKSLGVPVIPMVQLNRTVENQAGEDKRPTLTSLKQSGAIAEDARQVIFVYRPEYYFREPMEHEDQDAKTERLLKLERVRGHFYWVVAKNSHGPIGQVKSFCDASRSVVREWPGG